jgi:hypothetical protein
MLMEPTLEEMFHWNSPIKLNDVTYVHFPTSENK